MAYLSHILLPGKHHAFLGHHAFQHWITTGFFGHGIGIPFGSALGWAQDHLDPKEESRGGSPVAPCNLSCRGIFNSRPRLSHSQPQTGPRSVAFHGYTLDMLGLVGRRSPCSQIVLVGPRVWRPRLRRNISKTQECPKWHNRGESVVPSRLGRRHQQKFEARGVHY